LDEVLLDRRGVEFQGDAGDVPALGGDGQRGPMDALRRAPVDDGYRIVVLAWEGWHSQLVEKVAWVRSWAKRQNHDRD
jgi:hypothetical protein